MIRLADRIGERYGRLIVISVAYYKNNKPYVNTECDCGKSFITSIDSLRNGGKSCGCLHSENSRKLIKAVHIRITRSFEDKIVANLMSSAKHRCKTRVPSIEFSLTKEQYKYLIDGQCYYCGRSKVNARRDNNQDITPHSGKVYMAVGIDRLDSAKGYTKENSVSCCAQCNIMKNSTPVDQFIKRCKEIAERFK